MMDTYEKKFKSKIFFQSNLTSNFKNKFSKINISNQHYYNVSNTFSSSYNYFNEKFQPKYNIYNDGYTLYNTRLEEEDLKEIILTRLITSAISVFLCLICMMIYFCICVKKRIQIGEENREKTDRISQQKEDFDDLDKNKDEKDERFLTSEDKVEDNLNQNYLSQSKEKENNCTSVSFENVIEQNKSVDLNNNIYNPYSSNISKIKIIYYQLIFL